MQSLPDRRELAPLSRVQETLVAQGGGKKCARQTNQTQRNNIYPEESFRRVITTAPQKTHLPTTTPARAPLSYIPPLHTPMPAARRNINIESH